jgi:hypothetical protein
MLSTETKTFTDSSLAQKTCPGVRDSPPITISSAKSSWGLDRSVLSYNPLLVFEKKERENK